MTDKFLNFEYVPELAQYMLKQIVKKNVAHYYVYSFREGTLAQFRDAWNDLPGTHDERYAALRELSDASNMPHGVERYIDEIEAPAYDKDLLDWLLEGHHTYDVDDVLKEYGGDIGLMRAIALAWHNVKANELEAVVAVLEEYLNCGDDKDSEEGDEDNV